MGIKMNLSRMEIGSFFDQVAKSGSFHAYAGGWATSGNPVWRLDMFRSDRVPPKGGNYIRFKDDVIDLISEALMVTFSENKRQKLLRAAHRRLYEMQPYVFLYSNQKVTAVGAKVRNLRFNAPGRIYQFENTWMAE